MEATLSTWLLLVTAIAGWTVAVLVLAASATKRRQKKFQHSLHLRKHVEPYLLRRAADFNLKTNSVSTESTNDLDKVVARLCELADELNKHERMAFDDTMNVTPESIDNPEDTET
ncbi:MAG: hypothetical protein V1754_05810 [Pseudomonadota bacterium]